MLMEKSGVVERTARGVLLWATGVSCIAGAASVRVTCRLADGVRVLAECADVRAAQMKLRELKRNGPLPGPIEVVLSNGVHSISAPLRFTPEDSGTEQTPITYRAETPGEVAISGGMRITGWRAGGDGAWIADVPQVRDGALYFRQLFVDGRRATRARSPNAGFYHTTSLIKTPEHTRRQADGFYYAGDDLNQAVAASPDVLLVAYQSWLSRQYRIADFSVQTRAVRTDPMMDIMRPRSRYFIENAPGCLDAPGEWYLDRKIGAVRYIPLPGENMRTVTVVVPVTPSLLQFKGDPEQGTYVEHLRFRGIRFEHADWTSQGRSISGGQARCPMGFETPETILESGAISAIGLRHTTIEECEITRVGAHAITLLQGCSDNVIRTCHMHDLGGGGVYLFWCIPQPNGKRPGWRPRGPFDRILRNVIDNCFIHDMTHVFNGSVGVLAGACAAHNRITHNEISHGDYTGISVGWGWSAKKTHGYLQEGNVVEYNHVHHVMNYLLDDGGGIYLLGWQEGTRICHNWVHDVRHDPLGHGAKGIYPDQGTSGVLFEGNVVHDVAQGFGGNGGHECVVRNNIFAFSHQSGVIGGKRLWDEQVRHNPNPVVFENNIVYQDGSDAMVMQTGYRPEAQASRNNIYWSGSDGAGETLFSGAGQAGVTFADWQAKGHDKGTIVADPLFADGTARDLRLRPDSPALKMGFRETDLSKVGLYGDSRWTGLPARAKHGPIAPLPGPGGFVWDYEHETVGVAPVHSGRVAPGPVDMQHRIQVTDTDAATGKRSLMLVEGRNTTRGYFPFMYYAVGVGSGPVRASFQLKLPAATPSALYVSFRDYANSGHKEFQAGPHMQIDSKGILTSSPDADLKVALTRDVWIKLELAFVTGEGAAKTFMLTVTSPGSPAQVFRNIPYRDAGFRQAGQFYIVSTGPDGGVFLIDDVRVSTGGVGE